MFVKRLEVSIIIVAVFAALMFLLPRGATAFFMAWVDVCIAYEFLRAVKAENKRITVYCAVTGAAIPIGVFAGKELLTVAVCGIILMAALFAEAVFTYGSEKEVKWQTVAAGILAGLVFPLCLSPISKFMAMLQHGNLLVIMTLCLTSASNVGAYCVGMLIGKHRGFLKASPNKSVEGFAGSIIVGTAVIMLFGVLAEKFGGVTVNYAALLVYAVPGNIMAQLGDLAFSTVKRQAGIKDYSNLMPGHGGMLDRFDSEIFAVPVICLLYGIFPAF